MASANVSAPAATPSQVDYGYLLLLVIPVVTVCGNGLVIVAVLNDRQLKRSVTNRYIAALAISDLLVGAVPGALAVYVKVNGGVWALGTAMCKFYVSCDVSGSTASILHLLLISLDRYLAVSYPPEYQRYSRKAKVSFVVAIIWLISTSLSIPVIMGKSILNTKACWLENPEYMVYSSLLSFFIPAGIMTLVYVKIFLKLGKRHGLRSFLKNDMAFHLPVVVVQEVQFEPGHCPPPDRVSPDPEVTVGRKKSRSSLSKSKTFPPAALPDGIGGGGSGRRSRRSRRHVSTIDAKTAKLAVAAAENHAAANVVTATIDANTPPPPARLTRQIVGRQSLVKRRDCHRRYSLWLRNSWPESCAGDEDSCSSTERTNSDDSDCAERQLLLKAFCRPSAAIQVPITSSIIDRLNDPDSQADQTVGSERTSVTAPESRPGLSVRKLVDRLSSALHRIKETRAVSKEKKATKLVAVILGVFIISWLPFFTFNTIRGVCLSAATSPNDCNWLSSHAYFLATWLGYANSGLNPIIYGLINKHFRKTYKRLLRWPRKR